MGHMTHMHDSHVGHMRLHVDNALPLQMERVRAEAMVSYTGINSTAKTEVHYIILALSG